MKTLCLLLALLPVSTLLVSCDTTHADSRKPTVSQQDAYDVSWGLSPRKARGNPRMRYQYNPRSEQTEAPVSRAPEAAAVTAPAPALPPASNRTVAGSPVVPAALR